MSFGEKEKSMKRTVFKSFVFLGLIPLVLVLGGCATILNNKQNTVSSSSGFASEVTILENGSVVYHGSLPATINVNGSNNYTIQYKDRDGNLRTLQLQKKISGWFIADVLLIGGWIIDLITGDVMEYSRATVLPISYKVGKQFLLIDAVPDSLRKDLKVIGNIYK
jgi:hypothetical protein